MADHPEKVILEETAANGGSQEMEFSRVNCGVLRLDAMAKYESKPIHSPTPS